jgi:hypothetical protein
MESSAHRFVHRDLLSASLLACIIAALFLSTLGLSGPLPGFRTHRAPHGPESLKSGGESALPSPASVRAATTFYFVTFEEAGLLAGTNWSVSLNGVGENSSTSDITFSEANGSYNFTVGAVPGYETTTPPSGQLNVSGANVTMQVTFSFLGFAVEFQESGLLVGTVWFVTLNGTVQSSSASTITFFEFNGTYSYNVSAVAGWTAFTPSGAIVVSGASVSLTIDWYAPAYEVQFVATGLPEFFPWWINVTHGVSEEYFGYGRVYLYLANGTYNYTIASYEELYQPSPAVGTVTISGATVFESVVFSLFNSPVTFVESGLPSGASWQVSVGAYERIAVTGAIQFELSNGTYSFGVGSVDNLVPSPPAGSILVNGSTEPIAINFTIAPTFGVTFTEATLARGTNWSVTLFGNESAAILLAAVGSYPKVVTKWSVGAAIVVFNVSNGSYEFAAAASGFASIVGNVTIVGHSPPPLVMGFPAAPAKPAPAGTTSLLPDYLVIAAVAIAASTGTAIWVSRRQKERSAATSPPGAGSMQESGEQLPPPPL